jgi:hypothetical protein
MAYDSGRDRIVKVWRNGTFEWDGTAWSRRADAPVTEYFELVYHEAMSRTVCYARPLGCQGMAFTYLWDGTSWSTRHAPHSYGMRLAYDRRSGKALLWSDGVSCLPFYVEETWGLDAQFNWLLLHSATGARPFSNIGYDGGLDAVVLLSNSLNSGQDTRVWTGASWQRILHQGTPSLRHGADLVYDQGRRRLLAFGGWRDYGTTPNLDTDVLLARDISVTPVTIHPGTSITIAWNAPGEANRFYAMAASLGRVPGIPVPGGRVVPLNADALFAWSFLSQSPPFAGFSGRLDVAGVAVATISIPADPRLTGVRFFVGGVTVSGGAVARISNEESVSIQ